MQLKDYLRWGVIAGLFASLFIPFVIANDLFFPFVTGKGFAFRILVELLVAGWVALAVLDARFRPKFSWLLVAFVTFLIFIFISDVGAENAHKALWSNFERMDGWVTLVHLLGYFLVLGSVLHAEKLWERFIHTSIVASVIMGLYSFAQLAGFIVINQGGARVDGTFGNATYLAAYLLFHIFLTLWMLWRWRAAGKESYGVWLYGAALAIQGFVLIATATRGAVLGVLGGLVLTGLLIVFKHRGEKHVRRAAFISALVFIIVAGGLFLLRDTSLIRSNEPLSRITNISLEQKTVRARFIVWDMAWQGFTDRPVLGWGQGNFNYVFNTYYDPRMYDQEPWFDRAHNVVFDWLTAGGLLGLLAYLAIPLFALLYLWRGRTGLPYSERSILTGLLAAYGFHNLFVFDNLVSYMFFGIVLAYIHFRVAQPFAASWMHKAIDASWLRVGIVVVSLALGVGVAYALNVPSIRAAALLSDALEANARAEFSASLEYFDEALALRAPIGLQEIRERVAEAATQMPRRNASNDIKRQYFERGEEAIARHIEERAKNDARLWAFRGSVYGNFELNDLALEAFERAHELSPKKQTLLLQTGLLKIVQNRIQGGLADLRAAFELAPSFDTARIYYAVGAIYANDFALAEKLLVERFGTLAVNNNKLLKAYFDAGRHDLVAMIWEERARTAPRDPQTRLSLAAAYFQANRIDDALAELGRIKEEFDESHPDLISNVDFYIQEIRAGRRPQ